MNIKKYKELKAELKKEWSPEDFSEEVKKELYYLIKHNFYKNLRFTAGSKPRYGYIEQFTPAEELEELFGLPYTSCGDFGALWNTNTQAEAKTEQFYLKFRAVALDIENNFIFIFEDKKETFYYFNANMYEFADLMTKAEKIDQTERAEKFTKEANIIYKATLEVLKKYEGKSYGTATANKIKEEIKEKTKGLKITESFGRGSSFRLDSSKYGQGLKVSGNYDEFYYFKFLNSDNKIEIQEESQPKPEFKGIDLYNKKSKLAQKITQLSAELLPLVEEYNSIQLKLFKDIKDTKIFNYQIHSIAQYGLKD